MTDTADIETLRQLPLSHSQRQALEFWWGHAYGHQVPDITVEDNVAEDDVDALLKHGLVRAYRERGHDFIDLTSSGYRLARDIAEPKPPKTHGHRVWIELDPPDADLPEAERDALGDKRAALLTAMLSKLGSGSEVFWNGKRERFNIVVDDSGGYIVMDDHGQWFNLDYFAASAAEQAAA